MGQPELTGSCLVLAPFGKNYVYVRKPLVKMMDGLGMCYLIVSEFVYYQFMTAIRLHAF